MYGAGQKKGYHHLPSPQGGFAKQSRTRRGGQFLHELSGYRFIAAMSYNTLPHIVSVPFRSPQEERGAKPNHVMQATANSVRCAPASGRA
jgi:hypothetical protein